MIRNIYPTSSGCKSQTVLAHENQLLNFQKSSELLIKYSHYYKLNYKN